MNDVARSWDAVYRSEYGRRYPFEPLIVYVNRLKARGFNGQHVLDIGFGTVADMLMLYEAGYEVHGLEVSENAIKRARRSLDAANIPSALTLWKSDTPFPYDSGFFDLVVSIGALHYNLDHYRVLEEMRRILRPGGRFMISYHGPLFHYWKYTEVIRSGVRRYTDEYPNETMRGLEFIFFQGKKEIEKIYGKYFSDVSVSTYRYRVLDQDTSFYLVTGLVS